MAETVKRSSGSSACGHSFVSSFQECPRRWFLKFELGIATRYTPKQLTYGIAWHKAIERFYAGDIDPLSAGLAVLDEANATDKYEYPEDYQDDRARFEPMFTEWIRAVGIEIQSKCKVLSLEETLSVELPNGFVFTGRLDELLENRETGAVFIAEHKSTAYSLTEMERSVFVGDQVPGYMGLVQEAKPELAPRLGGCLLDVTYQRGKNIQARASQLYYDAGEIARFWLNVNGILSELSQKIAAYRSGVNDALLFPRSGVACSKFRCPYEAICRSFVDADSALPINLVRTEPIGFTEEEDIGL